jgi:hypothetical protein
VGEKGTTSEGIAMTSDGGSYFVGRLQGRGILIAG